MWNIKTSREICNQIQNSSKYIDGHKTPKAITNKNLQNISHSAQTRWLPLNDIKNRLLEQLPALKSYSRSVNLAYNFNSGQGIATEVLKPTTESTCNSWIKKYQRNVGVDLHSIHFNFRLLYLRGLFWTLTRREKQNWLYFNWNKIESIKCWCIWRSDPFAVIRDISRPNDSKFD